RRCGTGRRVEAGEGENPGDSDEGHPKADPAGPGAAGRATRNWQGGGGAMGMRRDAAGWEPRKARLPVVRGVPPFASGGRPSFFGKRRFRRPPGGKGPFLSFPRGNV